MLKLLWAIFLSSSLASATSPVSRNLDSITATGGATLSVPATGVNVVSDTASQTISNKTISGASNTLSSLPVATQMQQDSFYGNGSSTAFTLSFSIVAASGLVVYLDGRSLTQGSSNDYTVSGTTLTLNTAPATGQKILAVYSKF